MARKTIVVLGASRYYVRSIEAARRAGYEVIALDKNPNAVGFAAADRGIPCDIVDSKQVLDIAIATRASAVVPVNDYGVRTAAFVAARLGLPGISENAAHVATDKAAMRMRWVERGVPSPRFVVATSSAEFDAAVADIGYPCILKPAHGVGGASRGVSVVHEHGQLDWARQFAQAFYGDGATLLEEFVDAQFEHSAEVLIADGVPHVIAVADKVKSPLPYRVDKNVLYPTVLAGEPLQQLLTAVRDAVQALDITTGAAHVELATTTNGPVLFEVGARCGGGGTPEPIVPYSTGVEEFVEQVRLLAGDPPVQLMPSRSLGCNYHFLTPPPGKVKFVTGLDTARAIPGILDADVFVGPGDHIAPVQTGLHRAGFVIAGGQTRDEAIALGEQGEAAIRFEYDT